MVKKKMILISAMTILVAGLLFTSLIFADDKIDVSKNPSVYSESNGPTDVYRAPEGGEPNASAAQEASENAQAESDDQENHVVKAESVN